MWTVFAGSLCRSKKRSTAFEEQGERNEKENTRANLESSREQRALTLTCERHILNLCLSNPQEDSRLSQIRGTDEKRNTCCTTFLGDGDLRICFENVHSTFCNNAGIRFLYILVAVGVDRILKKGPPKKIKVSKIRLLSITVQIYKLTLRPC